MHDAHWQGMWPNPKWTISTTKTSPGESRALETPGHASSWAWSGRRLLLALSWPCCRSDPSDRQRFGFSSFRSPRWWSSVGLAGPTLRSEIRSGRLEYHRYAGDSPSPLTRGESSATWGRSSSSPRLQGLDQWCRVDWPRSFGPYMCPWRWLRDGGFVADARGWIAESGSDLSRNASEARIRGNAADKEQLSIIACYR